MHRLGTRSNVGRIRLGPRGSGEAQHSAKRASRSRWAADDEPQGRWATGTTAYLKNGGQLETAAAMANHSSTRTTQLYDRRSDQVSLDEIERVRI